MNIGAVGNLVQNQRPFTKRGKERGVVMPDGTFYPWLKNGNPTPSDLSKLDEYHAAVRQQSRVRDATARIFFEKAEKIERTAMRPPQTNVPPPEIARGRLTQEGMAAGRIGAEQKGTSDPMLKDKNFPSATRKVLLQIQQAREMLGQNAPQMEYEVIDGVKQISVKGEIKGNNLREIEHYASTMHKNGISNPDAPGAGKRTFGKSGERLTVQQLAEIRDTLFAFAEGRKLADQQMQKGVDYLGKPLAKAGKFVAGSSVIANLLPGAKEPIEHLGEAMGGMLNPLAYVQQAQQTGRNPVGTTVDTFYQAGKLLRPYDENGKSIPINDRIDGLIATLGIAGAIEGFAGGIKKWKGPEIKAGTSRLLEGGADPKAVQKLDNPYSQAALDEYLAKNPNQTFQGYERGKPKFSVKPEKPIDVDAQIADIKAKRAARNVSKTEPKTNTSQASVQGTNIGETLAGLTDNGPAPKAQPKRPLGEYTHGELEKLREDARAYERGGKGDPKTFLGDRYNKWKALDKEGDYASIQKLVTKDEFDKIYGDDPARHSLEAIDEFDKKANPIHASKSPKELGLWLRNILPDAKNNPDLIVAATKKIEREGWNPEDVINSAEDAHKMMSGDPAETARIFDQIRKGAQKDPAIEPPRKPPPDTSPVQTAEASAKPGASSLKGKTISVTRSEEPGVKPSPPSSKPHGLYLSPEGGKLGEGLGGETTNYDFHPSNPLDLSHEYLPKEDIFKRKGVQGNPASAGIKAAKKLLGDAEFERLNDLSRDRTLVAELKQKYPDVDWSKYYDDYERMEAVGAIEARKAGHDALTDFGGDIDQREVVALEDSAISTPKPPKSEKLAKPTSGLRPTDLLNRKPLIEPDEIDWEEADNRLLRLKSDDPRLDPFSDKYDSDLDDVIHARFGNKDDTLGAAQILEREQGMRATGPDRFDPKAEGDAEILEFFKGKDFSSSAKNDRAWYRWHKRNGNWVPDARRSQRVSLYRIDDYPENVQMMILQFAEKWHGDDYVLLSPAQHREALGTGKASVGTWLNPPPGALRPSEVALRQGISDSVGSGTAENSIPAPIMRDFLNSLSKEKPHPKKQKAAYNLGLTDEELEDAIRFHIGDDPFTARAAAEIDKRGANADHGTVDKGIGEPGRTGQEPAPSKLDAVDAKIADVKARRDKRVAGQAKKNSKQRGSVDLTPEDFTDAAELTKLYVQKAGLTFEAWVKEMVGEFGEAIRPHLKGLWDEHSPKVETKPTDATGITHESIDKIREETGWAPRDSSTKSDAQLLNDSKKLKGKEAGIAENVFTDKNATLADEESLALNQKLNDLLSDMRKAKGANNTEAFDLADAQAQRIAEALDESGSRQGRAFRARQFLTSQQTDPWMVERKLKKAGLSEKQIAKVVADLEKANQKVSDQEAKIADLEKKFAESEAKVHLESEAKRTRRTDREAIIKEIDDLWGQAQKATAKLSAGIDPEFAKVLGKLAVRYVELGAKTIDDAIRTVIEEAAKRGHTVSELDIYQGVRENLPKAKSVDEAQKLIARNKAELIRIAKESTPGASKKTKWGAKVDEWMKKGSSMPTKEATRMGKIRETVLELERQIKNYDFPPKKDVKNRSRQLELEEQNLKQLRAEVQGIIKAAEPKSVIGRVNDFAREAQLANPIARLVDLTANTAKMTTYMATNPLRSIISTVLNPKTIGRERFIWTDPGKWRAVWQGAPTRWKAELKGVLKGADIETIEKYGHPGGVFSRMAGASDVVFKDIYARLAYDDFALGAGKSLKLKGNDLSAFRRDAFEQLVREKQDGPLTQEQVLIARASAQDWAARQTFNIDNIASRSVSGLKETVGAKLDKEVGRNAGDAWRLAMDSFFRFSKVIGNVALEKVNYNYPIASFGEAGARTIAAKIKGKGTIPLKDARLISDLAAKGLTGLAAVEAGKQAYDWLKEQGWIRGEIVETKGGTRFVKWTLLPDIGGGLDAEQIGGVSGPMLYGATQEMIERSGLTEKQKAALWQSYAQGQLTNQPLASGVKNIADAADSKGKTWQDIAVNLAARSIIPSGVNEVATRMDQAKNDVEIRKASGPLDEFLKRLPVYRESLPSGEKKRRVLVGKE